MEQKFIGFVKFHGYYLGLTFLKYAYIMAKSDELLQGDSSTEQPSFAYKLILVMAWIFPPLWCAQGLALLVSVYKGSRRSIKLIKYACVGTFGLEAIQLTVWINLEYVDSSDGWIIYEFIENLYALYVLHTLEQMFADLEMKRQKAFSIKAIVCEGDGQSKMVPKQNYLPTTLPELYAMGVIQALRKLSKGRDKKLGEAGLEMSQNDRPIVEVQPVNVTEMI